MAVMYGIHYPSGVRQVLSVLMPKGPRALSTSLAVPLAAGPSRSFRAVRRYLFRPLSLSLSFSSKPILNISPLVVAHSNTT